MFVSWSCYFSLQHTPQWAVCLFGCSWARQIDSFIDTQAQKHIYKYIYIYTNLSVHSATMPSEHKTPKPQQHKHKHICRNTRGSCTLADGLSDSLYSGLKWTEGHTLGSEAKASRVSRLARCLRVDRFHNKLCAHSGLCCCRATVCPCWIQSILQKELLREI